MAAPEHPVETPPFEISLFGPLAVRVHGTPLPRTRSQKTKWLLAWLVLRGGHAEKADVAERFWPQPNHERKQARANLRQTLGDLRRVLGPEGWRLPTEYNAIRLDLSGARSDVATFLENAARTDDASLERAVALYQKGALLEGCPEPWVGEERDRLERAYLDALERLVTRAQAVGDPARATRFLRRIVQTDPFREADQHALIVALEQSGDFAGALSAYDSYRHVLRQELNTGPPPDLVRLSRTIRARLEDRSRHVPVRAPARPADAPATFFEVPARNPFWVDRPQVAQRLSEMLERHDRVALSGLPGVGKTQIALEFAYRRRAEYRTVLWLRAGAYDPFISGVRRVAEHLGIRAHTEPDDPAVIRSVRAFLEERSGWLLVLDNADDLALVRELLPSGGQGTVLLTTRAASCGSAAPMLAVPPMQHQEGMDLLLRRAKYVAADGEPVRLLSAEDTQALVALCSRLHGLPLALDQAGAYLEETKATPREYRALYDERALDLLAERGDDPLEHEEPITTALALLVGRLEAAHPAAADLLSACAFLGADGVPGTSLIPEELFREAGAAWEGALGAAAHDPIAWNALLKAVFNVSLLDREPNLSALAIHPLVQEVLRGRAAPGVAARWVGRACEALGRCFPEPQFDTWSLCSRLMPQVHACADHVRRYGVASLQAGHLLDRAGMYVWQRDRLDEAEALHGQALALLRTSAPRDEASIAHCLNNLATVYQQQGRITEALDHMHEALAIGRRALGAHHPRHAVHLNNLAGLRRDQGRYDEALLLYWQAVENTLRAVHEGGADLGRRTVGRAEGLARELLENLASYLNNIGVVLVKQNEPDFAGAVELFQYALGIRQVLLGSEHNRTLQSVNNLAATCGLAGQLEEALALLGGLCRAARAHPGLYSPMSLSWVYHNQANLYLRQGRYARSEARFRRALAIRRRELGPEHPLVAEELLSYSKLLDATGRTQEAEQVRREAAAIQERHLAQGQAG